MSSKDLSGRVTGGLVPSSMNAGNTVSDDPGLAMTAPGTPSVLPVPEGHDLLPQPRPLDHGRSVILGADGAHVPAVPEQSACIPAGGYDRPGAGWTRDAAPVRAEQT